MDVLREAEPVPSFSTDASRPGGALDRALGAHRSSNRDQNNPTYRCNYIGMRAVLRRRGRALQPGQRLGSISER